MSDASLPSALRGAIARDLRPVRPYAAPWKRTLFFAPLGALLVAASPILWGLRGDASLLPEWTTWGLSGLQALVGLLLVGAALREAGPGRTLSRSALAALVAVAVAALAAITLATAMVEPTVVPASARVRFVWECLGMAVVVGVPALAVVASLAWRLLPGRPGVAGALCGLGAGMLTDAGVRLFCQVTEPAHVFLAHGGAIAALVVLGTLVSLLVDRGARPAPIDR